MDKRSDDKYYRKRVPERRRPIMTAVEAVTKYGDDWSLLGKTPYGRAITPDEYDAAGMRLMERGELGRIAPGELDG